MSNIIEMNKSDVHNMVKCFLGWSLGKQTSVKVQLQKEFGLDFSGGEGENSITSDKELKSHSPNAQVSTKEYEMFAEEFKARQHFKETLSHKSFIQKAYQRFQSSFDSKNLTIERINMHDDTKLTCFLEVVGYTQRWIWMEKGDIWHQAWEHHFTSNSHHPEYYKKKNDKTGETVQNDMHHLDLLESIVHMLACRWERKLGGKEAVTNEGLLDIDPYFLQRYTTNDREKVQDILRDLKTM